MAKKKKIQGKFSWVVAYINPDYIGKVEAELAKYPEYERVEAYIPTIKVLRKTFKGKKHFEEVPLLFNYGFFKIPRTYAVHAAFLEEMKANISCIYNWVKDPVKVIRKGPNIIKKRDGRMGIKYSDWDVNYATASPNEIAHLLENAFDYSAHDSDDIDRIKPGDTIILKGYPFEGIEAEFCSLNPKKKEAKVKIQMFDQMKEVSVAYENIFFTIYKRENHDDSITTTQSLDFMVDNKTIDKVMFKKSKNEEDK